VGIASGVKKTVLPAPGGQKKINLNYEKLLPLYYAFNETGVCVNIGDLHEVHTVSQFGHVHFFGVAELFLY
jgi:hypothetical protein